MSPQLAAMIATASDQFSEIGVDTARIDAELLLGHVLGIERMSLLTYEEKIPSDILTQYSEMVSRRVCGEPVAYITGVQAFWDDDFIVSKHTLIPRQDTEALVESVLKQAPKEGRILDIGTGSGCILLSLLRERPMMTGVGLDISPEALNIAKMNAEGLGLADRAAFIQSNWFDALMPSKEKFSVIVSNPPYIPTSDIEGLMSSVRDFEPMMALDGGGDGLTPYRLITKNALSYLIDDGLLAVEVGILQANDVADMFDAVGLTEVKIIKDLPGVERVVCGKKLKN